MKIFKKWTNSNGKAWFKLEIWIHNKIAIKLLLFQPITGQLSVEQFSVRYFLDFADFALIVIWFSNIIFFAVLMATTILWVVAAKFGLVFTKVFDRHNGKWCSTLMCRLPLSTKVRRQKQEFKIFWNHCSLTEKKWGMVNHNCQTTWNHYKMIKSCAVLGFFIDGHRPPWIAGSSNIIFKKILTFQNYLNRFKGQ